MATGEVQHKPIHNHRRSAELPSVQRSTGVQPTGPPHVKTFSITAGNKAEQQSPYGAAHFALRAIRCGYTRIKTYLLSAEDLLDQ